MISFSGSCDLCCHFEVGLRSGYPPPHPYPPRSFGMFTLAGNSRQIRTSKGVRGQNLDCKELATSLRHDLIMCAACGVFRIAQSGCGGQGQMSQGDRFYCGNCCATWCGSRLTQISHDPRAWSAQPSKHREGCAGLEMREPSVVRESQHRRCRVSGRKVIAWSRLRRACRRRSKSRRFHRMGRERSRSSLEKWSNKVTPSLIHPERYEEDQANRSSNLPRADPHIL